MADRRTILQATAAVVGVGAYLGITQLGDDSSSDPIIPSATSPQTPMPFQQTVSANFQIASTIDQLSDPDTLPAVGVTNAGWVYWNEETDGWQQFTLGTSETTIPYAHIKQQRTRRLNGTIFVYPDEGSAGIQAAVDALGEEGGQIQLFPGTYFCNSQIRISNSDVLLRGAGTETRLAFADGFNKDLLRIDPGAFHTRVSALTIDGRKDSNESGNGIHLRGYNFRPTVDHVALRNIPENGITSSTPDEEFTYEPVFNQITIKNTGRHGFNLGYVADLYGQNLYVESTAGIGFRLFGAGSTLVHPHVYDASGEAGIYISESSQDTRLLGAYVDRNQNDGIHIEGNRITVTSSFVFGNSRSAKGQYDGLILDDATRCIITNSVFANLQGGDWQRYGVVETGGANKNIVALNQFISNAEAPFIRESNTSASEFSLNIT